MKVPENKTNMKDVITGNIIFFFENIFINSSQHGKAAIKIDDLLRREFFQLEAFIGVHQYPAAELL